MIRCDHGATIAADAARLAVMPLERAGGQAQFIAHHTPAAEGASLEPVLRWLDGHHREPLSIPALARRAAMSPRSFSRHFRAQTGTTPAQWIARLRIRRAQQLLETTALGIERIADEVGFGASATFRQRFQRVVGTSPQAYRRSFRRAATA
jgi:transcriptional regulator GlxA family with amidase domain